MRSIAFLLGMLLFPPCRGDGNVLIVADEFPAMAVLAGKLKTQEGISSSIVTQAELLHALERYRAVVVYVHGKLSNAVERACVDYANAGGRLIVLHHSISSGKRTNEVWFDFLGVTLPEGEVDRGGYKWIEPAKLQILKLTDHFVTTNKVKWPERAWYLREKESSRHELLPAFTLTNSEVYLNHRLTGPKTILLGFRYKDDTGKDWMQDRAGWYQPSGKGWLFYFQPGHSVSDFDNDSFSRLVINSVIWQP